MNNTSFPFYKVDKSHKGSCYRRGLRHSFSSGFRLAQLLAEHYLGSKLCAAAAELEGKGGVSAEDLEGSKERKGRRLSLAFVLRGRPASPDEGELVFSSATAAGAGGGSALAPLPKAAERVGSGVRLRSVLYLIISQQPPPSGKLGVSLFNTYK